jgi:hypothetical protein
LTHGNAYTVEHEDDEHWRVIGNDFGQTQVVDKDVLVVSTFVVHYLHGGLLCQFYLVEKSLLPLMERSSGAAAGYVRGDRLVRQSPQYFPTIDEALLHCLTNFPGNDVEVQDYVQEYERERAVK